MPRKGELTPFGAMIEKFRTRRGLTAEELGAAVGVSRQTLYRRLSGKSAISDAEMLQLLSALEIPVDEAKPEHEITPWVAQRWAEAVTAGSMARPTPWTSAQGAEFETKRGERDLVSLSSLNRRLSPRVYERVHGYVAQLEALKASDDQINEAARLMVEATFNKLNARDPRERTDEEQLLDIDDAWDFITEVLRRQGLKV